MTLPIYTYECILPSLPAPVSTSSVAGPLAMRSLYVGTTDGRVLVYPLTVNTTTNKVSAILERERALGHGKKPVTDIIVLDDVGIILTLCDGYLDTWHAMTLEPATVVPQNKGISLVARCQSGNEMTFQICVQQRRKLYLYEFVGRFELLSELTLPEPATSMMWINQSIYITSKNEYFTVDILDNSIVPLVSFETAPLMRLLSTGELLLKQDKKGMLTDGTSGSKSGGGGASLSVQGSPLMWNVPPSDLVVHFPYVLSLQPDQVEVHSTFSWKLFQRISTTSGTLAGIKGFVARNTALVGNDEMFVLAHSEKAVYALVAPPYPAQSEALVNSGNIEEGIFLLEHTCDHLRDYPRLQQQLNMTAAWTRFKAADWKRAMVHFGQAKVNASIVIPSFPMLLLSESQRNSDDEKIVTNIIKKIHMRSLADHPSELDRHLREACLYFVDYLESQRQQTLHALQAPPTSANPFDAAPTPQLDENTHLQLISAIFICRARFGVPGLGSHALNPPTAVWHFLMSLNEAEINLGVAFFEHWCTVNRYYVIIGLLYRLRKLNRKALDFWAKVGSGDIVSADPSQTGVDESIALLQTLDDVELIEEFAPQVFKNSKNDSNKFLSIFASKHRTNLLPLPWILSFLAKYDKSILERYLEYLVFELRTNDEKVETALAWHYLSLIPPSEVNGFDLSSASSSIPASLVFPQNSNASFSASSSTAASSSSASSSSSQPTTLNPNRQKLQKLLQQQKAYDAAAILVRIEPLPLDAEKILLYERIGDFAKALEVIVLRLHDFERAEAFCVKHEREGSDALLSSLLRIYLTLQPLVTEEGGGDEPEQGKTSRRAMDLIERNPTRFRPSTVLNTLPADTPLQNVMGFLIQSIRAHIALLRQQAVVAGIERSYNVTVTAERLALGQRSFLITRDTTCPICGLPIKPQGGFARYPNGVVVHVHCMKNKHVDPVTGRNFFKHPQ